MCDDTRSAENGEVVGEHMRPSSTLPICKPTEQCKCNNGSFVYTCPFTPYGHASMLAIGQLSHQSATAASLAAPA